MKIADFFIALGFQVKGGQEVAKTDQAMQGLNTSALKLLAITTAINAAFYAMLTRGVEVGVALQRFTLTTGDSADELQRWQINAARGNVDAKALVTAVGAIQKARAAIAFGNAEAAAPWMLLGIDPRQDPFKVLEQLRQQVLRLDPAIARQKLSEMGLGDDIFFMLRQGLGRGSADRRVIVSDEEARRLAALGGAWKEFLFVLGQVGARFSAQFAEPIAATLNALTRALTLVGQFTDWVEKGGTGADVFKYTVLGVVAALTALNIALGFLVMGPAGLFFGMLTAITILVAGLALLLNDLWTAANGGKSAFEWTQYAKDDIKAIAQWLGTVSKLFDDIVSKKPWDVIKKGIGEVTGVIPFMNWYKDMARARVVENSRNDNWNAPVSMTVNVQGGADPAATGRTVGRTAGREISDAMGQMPALSR